MSVNPSVRPYVTRQYCVETAKLIKQEAQLPQTDRGTLHVIE